ncbi:MAG: hypothetical protein L6290_06500 [Thermodesulfovibrionales bacterium]|nr:hypothetical protein [Thermodesulfovibrionales bacterium]
MTEIDLISPSRQSEWGWLAVVNFILGGAGSGFYLINLTTMVIDSSFLEQQTSVPYDIVSLSIITLGLLCVAIETGRPLHGYYVFSQWGKSWMSREIIAFTMFVSAIVLNYFFPHWILNIVGVFSALFFMITQAFMVFSARAVTSWNTAIMPFIFLSSGLASGAGVALLFTLSDISAVGHTLPQISLLCVAFNLAIWLFYVRWYSAVSFPSVTGHLKLKSHLRKMFLAIAFGHFMPILLLLLLLWRSQAQHGAGEMVMGVLVGGSGLAIIISVAAQKAGIILSAGYTRRIVLKV